MNVVAVTDRAGNVVEPAWLARAEAVHRQLRPQIPVDYVKRMHEIFSGGAEMAVAVNGDAVCGVTVFRLIECTFTGRDVYVDDLVADEQKRSSGVGHALLAHVEAQARERNADIVTLDSGTQRQQAHKFYFREGFTITSFHFSKPLK